VVAAYSDTRALLLLELEGEEREKEKGNEGRSEGRE